MTGELPYQRASNAESVCMLWCDHVLWNIWLLPVDPFSLCILAYLISIPDSKVHGANMGPTWGRQDPDGPHVGPMNLAIWDVKCAHDISTIDNLELVLVIDWCQHAITWTCNMQHTMQHAITWIMIIQFSNTCRWLSARPLCREFTGDQWISHTKGE